jgi:hypothetical protein
MTAPSPAGASDLTRRQALQAGGAAAAAAVVFLHPWAGAVARAAEGSDSVPKHLLRSTWRDLHDPELRAGDAVLRFEGVSDLPAAPSVKSLVDSEDAFLLTFSGPAGAGSNGDPLTVRHAELGTFDIAIGPSEDGTYNAVVNRVLSNTNSRRTPPRPARPAPVVDAPVDEGHDTRTGATEPAQAAAAAAGAPRPARRNKVIRKVETKRTKHGARCVVELASARDIDSLTAWLKNDLVVVATATRRVRSKRVAFNLKGLKKRFRKGVYHLTVIAHGEDGEQYARNVRVRLK